MLKRLDEAKLADSLEQRQKAEHFRLLEPAVDPGNLRSQSARFFYFRAVV
jgi:hypothetical protein